VHVVGAILVMSVHTAGQRSWIDLGGVERRGWGLEEKD